jgi:hypothetical protein
MQVVPDLAASATGAARTIDGLPHTVLLLVLDIQNAIELLFVKALFRWKARAEISGLLTEHRGAISGFRTITSHTCLLQDIG